MSKKEEYTLDFLMCEVITQPPLYKSENLSKKKRNWVRVTLQSISLQPYSIRPSKLGMKKVRFEA